MNILKKILKSFSCVLLCFALLLPLVGAAARAEQPLSVWVASDIHYKPLSSLAPVDEANTLPGDPLYSHVNDKGMLAHEADAIIYEFLSRFEQSSAKYLL